MGKVISLSSAWELSKAVLYHLMLSLLIHFVKKVQLLRAKKLNLANTQMTQPLFKIAPRNPRILKLIKDDFGDIFDSR